MCGSVSRCLVVARVSELAAWDNPEVWAEKLAECQDALGDYRKQSEEQAEEARKWRIRAETAERERDVANALLSGLTNEADANEAWKALILRAEAAERERDGAEIKIDIQRQRARRYEEALLPLPAKCEHSLYVGTEEQMRFDLEYIARWCRDALAQGQGTVCEHEWIDARNTAVESGEICIKCNAIRASNWEPPPIC